MKSIKFFLSVLLLANMCISFFAQGSQYSLENNKKIIQFFVNAELAVAGLATLGSVAVLGLSRNNTNMQQYSSVALKTVALGGSVAFYNYFTRKEEKVLEFQIKSDRSNKRGKSGFSITHGQLRRLKNLVRDKHIKQSESIILNLYRTISSLIDYEFSSDKDLEYVTDSSLGFYRDNEKKASKQAYNFLQSLSSYFQLNKHRDALDNCWYKDASGIWIPLDLLQYVDLEKHEVLVEKRTEELLTCLAFNWVDYFYTHYLENGVWGQKKEVPLQFYDYFSTLIPKHEDGLREKEEQDFIIQNKKKYRQANTIMIKRIKGALLIDRKNNNHKALESLVNKENVVFDNWACDVFVPLEWNCFNYTTLQGVNIFDEFINWIISGLEKDGYTVSDKECEKLHENGFIRGSSNFFL